MSATGALSAALDVQLKPRKASGICFFAFALFNVLGVEADVQAYLDLVLPLEVHGVGVVYPEEVGVFLHDRDGVILRKVMHLQRDGPVSAERRENPNFQANTPRNIRFFPLQLSVLHNVSFYWKRVHAVMAEPLRSCTR